MTEENEDKKDEKTPTDDAPGETPQAQGPDVIQQPESSTEKPEGEVNPFEPNTGESPSEQEPITPVIQPEQQKPVDPPEDIDGESVAQAQEGFGPEQQEEQPCDPRTMDCDELRDTFQDLSRNKQSIDATVVQLESSKETFNDPKIDEALEVAKGHQKKVNEKISDIIDVTFGRECKEDDESEKDETKQ